MGKNYIKVLIKKMNEIILIDWKFSQERMGKFRSLNARVHNSHVPYQSSAIIMHF